MKVTLAEYLAVPYVLQAESVPLEAGGWTCRLSFPELPGCVAEASTVEDAMTMVERRRVLAILDALAAGHPPMAPRPPLAACDPQRMAEDIGLGGVLDGLLDQDEAGLAEALRLAPGRLSAAHEKCKVAMR
ncbi:MAG TPA: hypothetical protein VHD15_04160 [Hyphomicrobiales bacterium]|nr:hypothetical protein [Hyphomicrobiales bacterium]